MKRGLMIILIMILLANAADADSYGSKDNVAKFNDNGIDEHFQEYFTYESMLEALNKLEAQHPDIVRVYDLTATIDEDRKGLKRET